MIVFMKLHELLHYQMKAEKKLIIKQNIKKY